MGSEDWLSVAWSLGAQGFGSVPGCPKAVLSQEPEKTAGCRLTALYTNSKSSKCDFSIKPNGLGCVPYLPALQFLQRACKRPHDKDIRVKQQNGGKVMSLLSFLVSVCLRQGFIT